MFVVGFVPIRVVNQYTISVVLEYSCPVNFGWQRNYLCRGGCLRIRGVPCFVGRSGLGQPGFGFGRVRTKAGGGVKVGLRGIVVSYVHVEVRAGQVDVGVFGADFIDDVGQVRRGGSAVAQLHIRLCTAPVGGFAAVVHPDSAAEHRDSLGVFAVRQVFFTHRQRPFHPRPRGEDEEEHTEGQ